MENSDLAETITDHYQRHRQSRDFTYFNTIGFLNVGYWKGIDDSMELAQINLMETLASFFPNKECPSGKGA